MFCIDSSAAVPESGAGEDGEKEDRKRPRDDGDDSSRRDNRDRGQSVSYARSCDCHVKSHVIIHRAS